jgi:LuxR family transcriptional regulator, activator of conjugal transfer of Ti plasmids
MEKSVSYSHFPRILSSSTPEAAAAKLYELIVPLGFSGLVYSSGRLTAPLIEGSEIVQRWIKHFAERNYIAVDPLYAAARKSVVPQFWYANQCRPEDSAEQVRIYQEIGEFGIAKGFDLSIRDHEDEASLCFYCENEKVDLQAAHPLVQIGALYLHECICRLSVGEAEITQPTLTARERECLGLVREGLTYAQIARRLNITERTVTFHLQNTKQKLGVSTLAQAIAIALLHQRI